MKKIYTPYFIPPAPENVSEFSFSAVKVLRFLERQELEPFHLRNVRKANFHGLEFHCREEVEKRTSTMPARELLNRSPDKSNDCDIEVSNINFNVNNNMFNNSDVSEEWGDEGVYLLRAREPATDHLEARRGADAEGENQEAEPHPTPTLNSHPDSVGACGLNESVDMFEETQPINLRRETEIITSPYFTPKNSKNKSSITKRPRKYTQIKKITSYFPVKKVKHPEKTNSHFDMNLKNHGKLKCPSTNNIFGEHDISSPVQRLLGNNNNFSQEETKYSPKSIDYNKEAATINGRLSQPLMCRFLYSCRTSPISNEIQHNIQENTPPRQHNIQRMINHHNSSPQRVEDESELLEKNAVNESSNGTKLGFSSDSQKELLLRNEIISITKDNSESVFNLLSSDSVAEIGLTLCYREGFCLLNKDGKTSGTPTNILICAKFLSGGYQVLDFTRGCFDISEPQYVLLHILESLTRKICYEAQALVLFILDNMNLIEKKACYDWCILDPGIGGWLLDPDHPPLSFEQLAGHLLADEVCLTSGVVNWRTKLLIQQSLVMECMYSKLTEEYLWDVFLYLETKIVPILAVLEATEIKIDRESVNQMSTILTEKLKRLEEEAERMVGHRLCLNSSLQLRRVLYDELKLDEASRVSVRPTSVKGLKSTSESALKLLVDVHPLPSLVLEYRHLFKLKSSYTDVILEHTKENSSISARWDLCSTATGRLASSNPNLQNIPKQSLSLKLEDQEVDLNLRRWFVARNGCSLVSADFQQIELRVLALQAGDRHLLGLLGIEGDVFTLITRIRLKKEDISSEDRTLTKTLIYALMYGTGTKRIADILSLDLKEAEVIRDKFLGIFPGLKEFNYKILNEVRKTKMLRSLSGRKRIFPNILSQNYSLRKYSERQAINFIIQGSAADICKGAMLRIELSLKEKNLNTNLLLQIHDELLWEVKNEELSIFKELVEEAMEANRRFWMSKAKLEVPLPILIRTGSDWGNMNSA